VRHARQGNAVGHIQTLFRVGCARDLTDGELLERFASRDGEGAADAFALLVERHGPMVLRVCQSVLRKRDDAEDALQATFLILACKASSIRRRDSVVSWLHGVAFRVAACQKGATARRHRHEMKATERPVADADGEERSGEVQETVAALAKARGLTYVVRVSPGPRPDSEPNDVDTALKSSVVYADPRNDLTEAVIADLNRRYTASEINRE
jgi:Sigma-70 region 2